MKTLPRSQALATLAWSVLPLAGALFWHWQVFDIVFVYWLETAVVGAYTLGQMLTARDGLGARVAVSLFFVFHFSVFLYAQLGFMVMLFYPVSGWDPNILNVPDVLRHLRPVFDLGMIATLGGIIASYVFAFVSSWPKPSEPRPAVADIMFKPYVRIFVQQAVVVFGGFAVMALPTFFPHMPISPALVIFVAAKTLASLLVPSV